MPPPPLREFACAFELLDAELADGLEEREPRRPIWPFVSLDEAVADEARDAIDDLQGNLASKRAALRLKMRRAFFLHDVLQQNPPT